jgi:hypothetical protein
LSLKKEEYLVKDTKMKVVTMALALLTALALSLVGCGGGGQGKWEELALNTNAITNTVEAIKADLSDIEAATEVIHVETRIILKGEEPVPDELTAMVETAHMSSHALLLLLPYMKASITELDGYKANPEVNRGEILTAVGKIEALRKLAEATVGSTKWASLMNWPVTDETSHDLVHTFIEDPAIKGVTEYKDAAEKIHNAMHGVEDAMSSMELNLELLQDMIKTAGKIE